MTARRILELRRRSHMATMTMSTEPRPIRHGAPDGGTEWIAILPDVSVWGWEVKFFFQLGDSQFQQMDESVKTALLSQPKLTRYVFCILYNRPAGIVSGRKNAMEKWNEHCTKWSTWASELGMTVEFKYIGDSELVNTLMEPGQSGRVMYWFDTTVLDTDWSGRWMPESQSYYNRFWGEYPWHPSCGDIDNEW